MKNQLQNLVAAISFFTRIPLYRLMQPPKESYSRVLPYATAAGWVVGAFAAGVWWMLSLALPPNVAVMLTVVAMVVLTGALHEDGFADFIDGFGGGFTKERILAIMKDSHIGTYGVVGLVLLFAVRIGVLVAFPSDRMVGVLVTGAVVGRFVGVLLPTFLPYARTVEASKIQVGLVPMTVVQIAASLLVTGATVYLFFGWMSLIALLVPLAFLPIVVIYLKGKIGGYTGDCCGMMITTAEVVWYVAVLAGLFEH